MQPTTRNLLMIPAFFMTLVLLAPGQGLAQSTFDGGGDGTTWEDPLNWNPDGVPGGNTNIGNGETGVVLSSSQAINELDITGDQTSGDGTLTHTAGDLTTTGWFKVGFGAGDTGAYNLSGSATQSGADNGFFGRDGGVGSISLADTSSFNANFIEFGAGGTGNAQVTGGTLSSNGEIVMRNGTAGLSAGNITAPNDIKIGDSGTYDLNVSGTGVLSSNNSIRFGDGNGSGTATVSGGQIQAGGDLAFKNDYSADISGGTHTAGQYFLENNASVTHSGGSVTANNWISIGNASGQTSTYNLSGGSVTSNNDWVSVGENGGGELNVSGSGSVVSNGNGLLVGRNGSGDGLLSIAGSTASIDVPELRGGVTSDGNPGGASTMSWTADGAGVTAVDTSTTWLIGTLLELDLTAWSDFGLIGTAAPPSELILIDNTGSATTGAFDSLPEGAVVDVGGGKSGIISYAGGGDSLDVVISFVAIPEPAGALLVLAGLATGLFSRRKR